MNKMEFMKLISKDNLFLDNSKYLFHFLELISKNYFHLDEIPPR